MKVTIKHRKLHPGCIENSAVPWQPKLQIQTTGWGGLSHRYSCSLQDHKYLTQHLHVTHISLIIVRLETLQGKVFVYLDTLQSVSYICCAV